MLNRVAVSLLFLVFFLAGCAGTPQDASTEAPQEGATSPAFEKLECVNASGMQEAISDLNKAEEAVSAGLFLLAEYGIKAFGSLEHPLVTAMQSSSDKIGSLSLRFKNRVDDCGDDVLRKNLDALAEILGEKSEIYERTSSLDLLRESGYIDTIIKLTNDQGNVAKAIFDHLLEIAEASIAESETTNPDE